MNIYVKIAFYSRERGAASIHPDACTIDKSSAVLQRHDKSCSFIFAHHYPFSRFFKMVFERSPTRSKLTDKYRIVIFVEHCSFLLFFLCNQTIQIATRARELCNLLLYPNYRVLRWIRNSRRCYFARLHFDFFPRAKLITRFVFLVSSWVGEILYICNTIGRSKYLCIVKLNYQILTGILSETSFLKNILNNLLWQIEGCMIK